MLLCSPDGCARYGNHPADASVPARSIVYPEECYLCFASGGGIRLKLNAMASGAARSLLFLVLSMIFAMKGSAQTTPGMPVALKHVEPGLENAVKWEWHVEPSENKEWGFQLPTPSPTPPPPVPVVTPLEIRPALYEVKHGDALILIGKKFGVTVSQLKSFNGLKDDKIRIGQILKIPTLAEVSAMAPPVAKRKPAATSESKPGPETGMEDKVRLQIFLDREEFSAGPIVGEPGQAFARILLLYESTHGDAKDDPSVTAKAQALVTNVFTQYKLEAADFRFIAPPNAEPVDSKPISVSSHPHPGKGTSHPPVRPVAPPTYNQLVAMSVLAYRTPWEFVAERFHCQEAYLHTLNDKLPAIPKVGTEFRVPNVVPFEIEKALDEPLQPQIDPKNPVTAAVIGRAQLNIYQGGALIAALPLSPARPGLHGRNSWKILDVIPHPRLGTFQKERIEQTQKAGSVSAVASPAPTASPSPTEQLPEQYLAAGPRNPVGILWINLAKSNSTEALPYGLHGTSIPDQMNSEESIGGLRLTNWDIARVVRQLPFGTPLEWK
jgi:lipoprotein-anchoring transpeptidase ErfK/SrfK